MHHLQAPISPPLGAEDAASSQITANQDGDPKDRRKGSALGAPLGAAIGGLAAAMLLGVGCWYARRHRLSSAEAAGRIDGKLDEERATGTLAVFKEKV